MGLLRKATNKYKANKEARKERAMPCLAVMSTDLAAHPGRKQPGGPLPLLPPSLPPSLLSPYPYSSSSAFPFPHPYPLLTYTSNLAGSGQYLAFLSVPSSVRLACALPYGRLPLFPPSPAGQPLLPHHTGTQGAGAATGPSPFPQIFFWCQLHARKSCFFLKVAMCWGDRGMPSRQAC